MQPEEFVGFEGFDQDGMEISLGLVLLGVLLLGNGEERLVVAGLLEEDYFLVSQVAETAPDRIFVKEFVDYVDVLVFD